MSDGGGSDPGIHDAGSTAAPSCFRDDRRKDERHLGINRNDLEFAFNPARRSEPSCSECRGCLSEFVDPLAARGGLQVRGKVRIKRHLSNDRLNDRPGRKG